MSLEAGEGCPAPVLLDYRHPPAGRTLDPDKYGVQLTELGELYSGRLEILEPAVSLFSAADHVSEPARAACGTLAVQLELSLRLIQGHCGLFQPQQPTEFEKRRAIIPAVPSIARMGSRLVSVETAITDMLEEVGPQFLGDNGDTTLFLADGSTALIPEQGHTDFGNSDRSKLLHEVLCARDALSRIEAIFGSFHIWTKSPHAETARAICRSFQNGEADLDAFLRFFTAEVLEREPSELDSYIAREILGMVEQGDSVEFKTPDFSKLTSDADVAERVLHGARRRFVAVRNGTKDRLRLPYRPWHTAPFARPRKAVNIGAIPAPEPEPITASQCFLEASRSDREALGRIAGLDREDARLLGKICDRKAQWNTTRSVRRRLIAGATQG